MDILDWWQWNKKKKGVEYKRLRIRIHVIYQLLQLYGTAQRNKASTITGNNFLFRVISATKQLIRCDEIIGNFEVANTQI